MEEDYLLPYADPLADDYSTVLEQPMVGAAAPQTISDSELIDALIRSLAGVPEQATSRSQYGMPSLDYSRPEPKPATKSIPAPRPRGIPRSKSGSEIPMGFNLRGEFIPFGQFQRGYFDEFGRFHGDEYPAGVRMELGDASRFGMEPMINATRW